MKKTVNKIKNLINRILVIFSPRIVRKVRREKLSYLDHRALFELYKSVCLVEKLKLQGIFIEAGCALGGSAIVIAEAKNVKRQFFIFDVFGMIPSPTENDSEDAHTRYEVIKSGKAKGINSESYYGYEKNLLDHVNRNFKKYNIDVDNENIHFVEGLYQNTLEVNQKVAFAHIDADWYDSVMICLEEIVPNLVPGAVLIIDDYQDWNGCKRAVDTYFANKQSEFIFFQKSRLHIIRK
jgi:SAM-dependent methyltransferase